MALKKSKGESSLKSSSLCLSIVFIYVMVSSACGLFYKSPQISFGSCHGINNLYFLNVDLVTVQKSINPQLLNPFFD